MIIINEGTVMHSSHTIEWGGEVVPGVIEPVIYDCRLWHLYCILIYYEGTLVRSYNYAAPIVV